MWYMITTQASMSFFLLAVVFVLFILVILIILFGTITRSSNKGLLRCSVGGLGIVIFSASLTALVTLAFCKSDVPENRIIMELSNGRPTGNVIREGETRGQMLFRDRVSMKIEDTIEGGRKMTVTGKDVVMHIKAIIVVKDPNLAYSRWRDSDERPSTTVEAHGNILGLISAQYAEAMKETKDWSDSQEFPLADRIIRGMLAGNGLELRGLKVVK